MRLRLLIVSGIFIAALAVTSAFLVLNQDNSGEVKSNQTSAQSQGALQVRESQGDPQSTSHLLQGTQPDGNLQSSQTGLQKPTDSQQLQPNSGRDSF